MLISLLTLLGALGLVVLVVAAVTFAVLWLLAGCAREDELERWEEWR